MSNVVVLNIQGEKKELNIKTYRGHRVVTFKDVDRVHQRPSGTARVRFNENRKRFIEGKHYFIAKPGDPQMYGFHTSEINNRGTIVLTQSGYLRLVKTFGDDLAWDIQDILIESYFQLQEVRQIQAPPKSTPVHDLHLSVAKSLTEVAGVKPGIALATAYSQIEKRTGEDLSEYKRILPPAEHETGFLNATEVGKRVGLSARSVNQALAALGFQYQVEDSKGRKTWRLTDKGKKYGEEMPFERNGHSGYQIRWTERTIDLIPTE